MNRYSQPMTNRSLPDPLQCRECAQDLRSRHLKELVRRCKAVFGRAAASAGARGRWLRHA